MYLPEDHSKKLLIESTYFGIDLGTTYTLVAVVNTKDIKTDDILEIPVKFIRYKQKSPFELGGEVIDEKVASIIAIHDKKPYCGNKLYDLKGNENFKKNFNLFYHWKLDLGIERYPLYPNAITENLNTPAKVASKILNFCRIGHTKNKQTKLYNTVITVPASFQMNQRNDVLNASQIANIDVSPQMLIDEPNAAFIGHFNSLSKSDKEKIFKSAIPKNILVFDFGGGTCDLSILSVAYSPQKGLMIGNKAISRYNDLGGQDVDTIIAEEILYDEWLKQTNNIDDLPLKDLTEIIIPQLSTISELYKKAIAETVLAQFPKFDWTEKELNNIKEYISQRKITYKSETNEFRDIIITAKQLEEITKKLYYDKNYKLKFQDKVIKSISTTINEILEKGNLSKSDVDYILTVGGSSKNPFIISNLSNDFPNSEVWIPSKPDKLVAEGAAIYSFFYYGFGKSIINPICSETIGIETENKVFYPLIEKGTELPVEISIPHFKLQSNTRNSIVIPICINSVDYIIQELVIPLERFYDISSEITINATLDTNKVLFLEIYINKQQVLEYKLENPFFIGSLSKEQIKFVKISKDLEIARRSQNANSERKLIIDLLSQYYEIRNYHEMALLAETYLSKYDANNSTVLNYHYIGNKNIGRTEAAKKSLDKAIKFEPNEPAYRYNYSLLIEDLEGKQKSLEYLENLSDYLKKNGSVKCRIVILMRQLGQDVKDNANIIANSFENSPDDFSEFDRKNLLRRIFDYAELPFKNIQNQEDKERAKKVLKVSAKPLKK